jgi:hypothetical protein
VLIGIAVAFAGVLVVSGVDFRLSTRALTGICSPSPAASSRPCTRSSAAACGARYRRPPYTTLCYATCALACLGVPARWLQLSGYGTSTWLALAPSRCARSCSATPASTTCWR